MKEEMLGVWAASLHVNGGFFVGVSMAAFSLIAFDGRLASGARASSVRIRALILVLSVGIGLWLAWTIAWLGDDAFISFRYAENFAKGRGLVFNPGEWVEGYTNFLWTFLLGLAGKVGWSIPHVALFGNLCCFVGCILVASRAAGLASPAGVFPFAAMGLAGSAAFQEFATSGLETMLVALCVVAALWASTRRDGALWAGTLLVAAVLCRPDQILLWGCMGLALVSEDLAHGPAVKWWRRLDGKRYLRYGAPLLLVYVPYFVWRWNAYGDLLPNTFYAKAPGVYFEQGAVYLLHTLLSTGGWLWLPALVLAAYGPSRSRDETRYRIFIALSLPLFGFYVAAVGGDFMEHRFFVPLLPAAWVTLEVGLRWRIHEAREGVARLHCLIAALALAASILPMQLIGPRTIRWNLAAEHTYYPLKSLLPLEVGSSFWSRGVKLRKIFPEGSSVLPRTAVANIGMAGYLSGLPIVDMHGLTNRRIGRKPVPQRRRPGHERVASAEEVIAEGAVLTTELVWPEELLLLWMGFHGEEPLLFVQYDPHVFGELSKRDGMVLPDPEEDVSWVIETQTDPDVLAMVLEFYEGFLRRHPQREHLLRRLESHLGASRADRSSR